MPELTHAERHAALVAYLNVKVQERDWHGVSDAANDLRVLEAEQAALLAGRFVQGMRA